MLISVTRTKHKMIQSKIKSFFPPSHYGDDTFYLRSCDASWNSVLSTSPCGNVRSLTEGDGHLLSTAQKSRCNCEYRKKEYFCLIMPIGVWGSNSLSSSA